MARVSDIIEGLAILAKYREEGPAAHIGGADHDRIFGLGVDPEAIDERDRRRLEELGWHWREWEEIWERFV
jgi:hypothetical protein